MPNNKASAKKAMATIRAKFKSDAEYKAWRASIGAKGGKISRGGGFKSEKIGADGLTGYERARIAGRKGGQASRIPSSATAKQKKQIHNILEG